MEKENTRIAVLLTVHNRKKSTIECLEALHSQDSSFPFDVYLTDDGCTDGTSEAVTEGFPKVRILDGDGNLFWNRGMYKAWQAAAANDYDFYLWLNDDTYLFADSLRRLLECSSRHNDKALIVGSTCSTTDPDLITYGGWTHGKLHGLSGSDQECETVSGNIVLIPRFVFEHIGFNDPYYRHSIGDTDYGLRVREHGMNVIVAEGKYGTCDLHAHMQVWMDPSKPFRDRAKHMFSPTGNNPFEYFHFRRIHYGLLPACKSFITNFIHLLLPGLWK